MTKFQQRLGVLILLVALISGVIIYFTIDIHTFSHFDAFKPWSIALALLFLTIGMYFDGTRLTRLVAIAGERITFIQALQVIFGNYFLAMLTPGAAGGAGGAGAAGGPGRAGLTRPLRAGPGWRSPARSRRRRG